MLCYKKHMFLQLCLDVKCDTTRNKQVLEKKEIKKQLSDEDKRLFEKMEKERINTIRIQEALDNERKIERKVGALQIMDQIKFNEQVNNFYYYYYY